MDLPLDLAWLVPLVGGLVFFGALFLGWNLLRSKPQEPQEPILDAKFLQGVTNDRRSVPRRKGNTVEVEIKDPEDNTLGFGIVMDRSQGGLRIHSTKAFAEGTTMKVRPSGSPNTTLWTEVLVRTCHRCGTDYEIGCQFLQTPNWNVMLQFG